jgi:predicted GTPase
MAMLGKRFYFLYRLASFGLDPGGAVLREARDMFGGKVLDASTAELKRWAVGYCVRKAGHYAIQLYSGQLVLSDVDFDAFQSPNSQRDVDVAERRDEALADEPLRVLVLGQVKAGKSSLINALFGETRAAVDVVPRTQRVEPFVLERDGLRRAIILDTAGYADAKDHESPFTAARREVLRCDVVLVVCSAMSAARDADRRLLDELRRFFQAEPDRLPPPLIGVVTHIDQLRPWNEWQPPYNLLQPQNAKARNIAAATQSVADDLAIPIEHVVPVCLQPGRIYNVDDTLVPAILEQLTDAERVKYLRCLREFHDAEYWRRLLQQAVNSGRLLWSAFEARRSS